MAEEVKVTAAAALHGFGYTVDGNNLFLQLHGGCVDLFQLYPPYSSRPPSRAPSAKAFTRP